jgi:hypothetical protein
LIRNIDINTKDKNKKKKEEFKSVEEDNKIKKYSFSCSFPRKKERRTEEVEEENL